MNINNYPFFQYTASGLEPDHFEEANLSNRKIIGVFRPTPIEIITDPAPPALPLTPGTAQVKYVAGSGQFIFGSNLGPQELITIFYL